MNGPVRKLRSLAPPAETPSILLGSLSLGAAQVTVAVVFALASLYLVRSLPTEEFGRVAFGLNVHLLLLTAGGFGLSTAVMAEVAQARGGQRGAMANVHGLLVVRLATVALLLAAGLAWAALAADVLPALAAAVSSVYVVQDFLVGILAGQLRARAAALVIVSQPASYLLLLALLEVPRAESVLAVLLMSVGLSLLLAIALTRADGAFLRRLAPVGLAPLREALRLAGSAYLLTLFTIGFVVLPIVVLGTLGMFVEAAALSIVMTLARFMPESLALVVAAVYFPRARSLPAGPQRQALFRGFVALLLVVAVPAGIGLAIFGGHLLHLLFDGRYDFLAPELAIASALVVTLPVEALLIWRLFADGRPLAALVGVGGRLVIVLVACLALVLARGDAATFKILVASYPLAVGLSLVVQAGALARQRRFALPVRGVAIAGPGDVAIAGPERVHR